MTKVTVIQTNSYETPIVEQAIIDLLAYLSGMSQFIQPGDRVLVKPEYAGSGEKGFCVTTRPQVATDCFFLNNFQK